MTHHTGAIIRGIFVVAVFLGTFGWLIVSSVRKADDPARMVFKWLLTVPVVLYLFYGLAPMVLRGDQAGAIFGISGTAGCGVVLAIIWRHSIAGLVAKPFGSLYDGGDLPPIPRPAYSVAQSRQKQGRYLEAVTEVQKQLERFPTDVEGQLLLAQIQAENLHDLPAAEETIQRFCQQPGHATENVVFALYSLADWYLGIAKDQQAARSALQKVIDLFPESEFALGAAHRIAHLGSKEMMLDPHDRQKFVVPEGERNVGLLRNRDHLKPTEIDPEQLAAEYVSQLEQYPQDLEAREKLAVIYADHYKRIDLATDQLEQMIEQPNQPARLVVHWLNLLADLQVRCSVDYETVKQTLQRIIDRGPNLAAAEIARNRLALLKLEFRARETPSAVKMGSYEQKIGLKPSVPAFAPRRYQAPR
jgi:tetratricopeptide (TPR) repeat protein